ncbi:hypothetical protein Taro_019750 [Colocasia esculenta]|uniref:Uncharacterized protein n=1 Tax=Colocasia esculenta TaxID=4460 RepID=A0A843V088_COLES|nr:hypothetical protein [Colocasia esculenta]
MDLLLISKASIRNSSSSSLLLLPLGGTPLLPFWMQELFPALLFFSSPSSPWRCSSAPLLDARAFSCSSLLVEKSQLSHTFGVRGSWTKCVDTQADCVDTTGYWLQNRFWEGQSGV